MACHTNCKTCRDYSTFCTSCKTGFSQVDIRCVADTSVAFSITLNSPTATSASAELSKFQNILQEFKEMLAGLMGEPYISNPDLIVFNSVASGSVVVAGNMGIDGSDPTSVLNDASNINSGQLGSYTLIGSSYSASGFTATETTSPNLPLILGISIPVAVIFIVVVVIIIVKVRKPGNSIGEREVVKIEEANANQVEAVEPNDTANNLKVENKV